VSQSRRHSPLEAWVSIIAGWKINLTARLIVLPAFQFLAFHVCLALPGHATPCRALYTQHFFQKNGCDGGRHELVVWWSCDLLAVHEMALPYRQLTDAFV
jgi:hypothetical protein